MRTTALTIATVTSFAACSTTATVQPREILVFAKPPAGFDSDRPYRVFVGMDGRTRRFSGDPDVSVRLVGGGSREFDSPVLVRETGNDRVTVYGGGQAPVELGLDQIEAVELERFDLMRGLQWASVGLLAFTGLMLLTVGLAGGSDTTTVQR